MQTYAIYWNGRAAAVANAAVGVQPDTRAQLCFFPHCHSDLIDWARSGRGAQKFSRTRFRPAFTVRGRLWQAVERLLGAGNLLEADRSACDWCRAAGPVNRISPLHLFRFQLSMVAGTAETQGDTRLSDDGR